MIDTYDPRVALLGEGPAVVLIPLKGFSSLDQEGKPFHDPEADASFVDALQTILAPGIALRKLPWHVNDPAFAEAMVEALCELLPAPLELAPAGR